MTPGLTINSVPAQWGMPARPVTRTPPTQDDIADALYGGGTPQQPYSSTPLPSWLPQNVQNYINQKPSYAEGETQGWQGSMAGGEPYSPTPQTGDLQRLFQERIARNAPPSAAVNKWDPKILWNLIQSGHAVGQSNI